MLWISTDILKVNEFRDFFKSKYSDKLFIDLSKVSSSKLVEESDSLLDHQKDCIVFLGYLEPGWMLEIPHQTRLRKLFRKFEVGMITHFKESLPFSWKNEINTLYLKRITV